MYVCVCVQSNPVMTFEPDNTYLYSVAWSKTRPMVFAAAAANGNVYVYDLNVSAVVVDVPRTGQTLSLSLSLTHTHTHVFSKVKQRHVLYWNTKVTRNNDRLCSPSTLILGRETFWLLRIALVSHGCGNCGGSFQICTLLSFLTSRSWPNESDKKKEEATKPLRNVTRLNTRDFGSEIGISDRKIAEPKIERSDWWFKFRFFSRPIRAIVSPEGYSSKISANAFM